jgi:pimeloyl-ACP methyl ester carboxylesterase
MPLLPVNGTELHYIQTGEGPDVVLVHGLASSLAFWYSGVALPLRHRYRVTTYDLRGHGKSGMPPAGYTHLHMADDLFHLVERLKLERFHLVGHSYGGLICLSFALRHPGRLKSLALADVPVGGLSSNWPSCWPALSTKLQDAGVQICGDDRYPELRILEEMARPEIRSQIKEIGTHSSYAPYGWGKGSEKTVKRWLRLLNETTARVDFRSRELSVRDFLEIETPTLVTYGMKSKWKSSGDILRKHLPHPRVSYVEGAGHAHPWERPGDFVQRWFEFIASAEETAPYAGRERRRYGRYEFHMRLDLWVGKDDFYPVETVNVSMTGLLVLCPRSMEIGSEVTFFPPADSEEDRREPVRGRVVRLGRALSEEQHLFGITFRENGQVRRFPAGLITDAEARCRR